MAINKLGIKSGANHKTLAQKNINEAYCGEA